MIPDNQVNAALQAGSRRAVMFADPMGRRRWIPEDMADQAQAAGGMRIMSADELVANPDHNSTYKMTGEDGKILDVPFSKIQPAKLTGRKFWTKDDANRYQHDSDYAAKKAAPSVTRQFYQAMTRRAERGDYSDNPYIDEPLATIHNVGGRAFQGIAQAVRHPIDTVQSIADTVIPLQMLNGEEHPLQKRVDEFKQDWQKDPRLALENAGGDALGMYAMGKVIEGVDNRVVTPARDRIGDIARSTGEKIAGKVAGRNVDTVIPGDTVTPRQRYEIAKKQGVNLDLAQATNGRIPAMAKTVSEHSMLGGSDYEKLQAANYDALNNHTQGLLNQTAPPMTRVEFGDAALDRLLKRQQELKTEAAQIFGQLSTDTSAVQPDMVDIRKTANRVLAENADYYAKHPEFLKGAAADAWNIVERLAKGGDTPELRPTGLLDQQGNPIMRSVQAPTDTWSNLFRLRNDLADQYHSPEIGPQAEDWLKQQTDSIDNTAADAKSGLPPEQLERFRVANDINRELNEQFDTPQSPFYGLVRSRGGLQVADLLENLTPSAAAYIRRVAPELMPQYQRQVMERLLSPAGNQATDWSTLPKRFNGAVKEQLGGVLTPEQLLAMENIARISSLVNPETATKGIPFVDGTAMVTGIPTVLKGALTGSPGETAAGTLVTGAPLVNKGLSKAITSPKVVEGVMKASKGPAAWIERGAGKLKSAGISDSQIANLRATAPGRQILKDASDLSPQSKGMQALVSKINR